MPATTIPRMHCVVAVKISSYSIQTKTFLTYHSQKILKFDHEATIEKDLLPVDHKLNDVFDRLRNSFW